MAEETKVEETTNSNGINCVWKMGTPCDGERFKAKMFKNSLEVPICQTHLDEHREVMVLVSAGHDIETVVEMSPEERKRNYYTLQLSGVDLGNVEI